jgi:gas vesicle protein
MKDIFNFLLGAMVGAIFALLFAPQSGEELRANIQTTAEKDWQSLQVQWQAEMEKIHARLNEIQAQTKGTLEEADAESEAGETA